MATTLTLDEDFEAALQSEDELGLVVRAHIFIEASLLKLLAAALVHPKHAEKMNLEYSQRVQLAIAAGLKPQYESPLLALGTLRNAFAHRLGTRLTKDRVDGLYSALSPEDKSLVQTAHQRARKKRPEAKIKPFSQLTPKDQFIMIALALRAMLEVAAKQATAVHGGDA